MSAVLSAVEPVSTDPEGAERTLRVQLAAAYRLVEHFGWSELIYGHLTVRLPGETPNFLINPYGLNYEEITASSLVRIDVDGNVVGDSNHPVNRAGFVIHSAVHMANSVNKCVMHTHTRAGMAVADLQAGLLQVHMYSTGFNGRLAYHDYEGPSLDLGERKRLLSDLGAAKAMILRNHGLLTVGRTIPEAFIWLYRLERACQVQLDAMAAGRLRLIDPAVVDHSNRETDRFLESEAGIGELEFQALMRRLDRIDPSYRD